ncbi:beta-2-glycoprotein 1 [Discoglossus pictus]
MLWFNLLLCSLCILHNVTARKGCARPPDILFAAHKPEKVAYEAGDFVVYSCKSGYMRYSGSHQAFCLSAGVWNPATLTCKRRNCVKPSPLENGNIHHTETNSEYWISYSCNEGYMLHGSNKSMCTERGTWSGQPPTCEPITCPPPPTPEFGKVSFYIPREANVSSYLDVVKYECLPHYALFGNETAICGDNGNWSALPECRDVKCNRPTEIANGFMTYSPHRKYDYGEHVTYGCKPTYVLEGPRNSSCGKYGEWTTKPSCKAPCSVTTKKAVVLYNGKKIKVDKIAHQQIQHGDILGYFCKNKQDKCAYTVDTPCHDGNLTIPSCYKEPSSWNPFYTAASDMQLCSQTT